MSILLSGIASLAGRVVGSHLFANHAAKAGIGTIQSIGEGLGLRFIAGFGLAGYLFSEPIRHAINALLSAVRHAVIT